MNHTELLLVSHGMGLFCRKQQPYQGLFAISTGTYRPDHSNRTNGPLNKYLQKETNSEGKERKLPAV